MRKSILFIGLTLALNQRSHTQPVFENDTSYSAFGDWILPDLDSIFHINNQPEFSFRVWVEPALQRGKELFILSLKKGKWSVRLFRYGWKMKPGTDSLDGKEFFEMKPLKDDPLSLIKQLKKNEYLEIPRSEDLRDKYGNLAHQYVFDGVFYLFELISAKNKRIYSYHCPGVDRKEYPYIRAFKEVLNIISLLHKYFGVQHSPC